LKRTQALETFVPVVVTADASGKESARRVLAEGAFDLISTPLDLEQAVRTIRLALWQSRLSGLLARKEKVVDKYRQHLADYPDAGEKMEESFMRALAAFEITISSVEQSILRMDESDRCVSNLATQLVFLTKKRALERLGSLPGK
jgi:DNA-binding NtrC family response regulator